MKRGRRPTLRLLLPGLTAVGPLALDPGEEGQPPAKLFQLVPAVE